MPRSVFEIEAEMAHLKNEGAHPLSKEMRALREELYEADPSKRPERKAKKGKPGRPRKESGGGDQAAEIERLRRENRELKALMAAGAETCGPDESVSVTVEGADWATDEWHFVAKCCAELELDLTQGVTSNLAKKVYQRVHAKLMTWRILREIYEEVGVGARWPSWPELGRNPNSGEKDPKYDPERIKAEAEARRRKPAPDIPRTTEAGMAIRPGKPSPEAVLGQFGDVRGEVMAQVGAGHPPGVFD